MELPSGVERAYLPSTGRVWELLDEGRRVFLVRRQARHTGLDWDLYLLDAGGVLVWADPRAAARVLEEGFAEGRVMMSWGAPSGVWREVGFGNSRLDLLISGEGRGLFLEVKAVTLVRDGVALFPDAPTTRGTRQLKALVEARGEGFGAGVAFVVQRGDARSLQPNADVDRRFVEALREAREAGVDLYAYGCTVGIDRIVLADPLELCPDCSW